MARDFTLSIYKDCLRALRSQYEAVMTFRDFLRSEQRPQSFVLIRHDVDRKPQNALEMAKLEARLGVSSSYYFRAKAHTFKPNIMRAIEDLGHEIGYHYESLSDCGDMGGALKDFELKLREFREHVQVDTISMHGKPLSPFDNRDMWRDPARHRKLKTELGILGELYLDIDYTDIAYIGDTGRNFASDGANLRDQVDSDVILQLRTCRDVLDFFSHQRHPRAVFQVHPERWTDEPVEWYVQWSKDQLINAVKWGLRLMRSASS